jgi:MYXO-CTERM domain-containing protein
VRFERIGNGPEQAILSPLRFHYDSDQFSLPIRLGLINSSGTQDLVVTILARGQRYEVANYDNVAIPTNIDVTDKTRSSFGAFYGALFDDTVHRHPRAVVTEYSWASNTCDPCPTPPLQPSDILTLGADALPSAAAYAPPGGGAPIVRPQLPWNAMNGFVLTRLHARYTKDALGDDLVFRAAPPIVGGREFLQSDGKLEQGARSDATNNFQARYAIRHPWTGPIACNNPRRGVWGGPPSGEMAKAVQPAAKIGFLPRAGANVSAFVRGALPPESTLSRGVATPLAPLPAPTAQVAAAAVDASTSGGGTVPPQGDAASDSGALTGPTPPPTPPSQSGCSGCSLGSADASAAAPVAALVAFVAVRLRRRTARPRLRRGAVEK